MFKSLRKLGRKLLDPGNLKKYLIYAFGEILLVMIGILLALQVNNWNEERKANLKERELLKGLQADLDKNIESLQKNINFQNFTIRGITQIIHHLQNPTPNPNDSLLIFYDFSNWYELTTVSAATYASLKNYGLEIIGDKEIRNKIIELFEVVYSDQVHVSRSVSPVMGQVSLQLAVKKKHMIERILASDKFRQDDTYFELVNFLEEKEQWKKDFIDGEEVLLEETLRLKTEIVTYLNEPENE